MTQQPFSRPGAIDLSALKQPSAGAPAGTTAGAAPSGAAGPSGGAGGARGAYVEDVTEQNFQSVLEASMVAPVVLVFYSPSRSAESATMADDLATVVGEYDGRFLAGLVDIDAAPQIAQAMQIPSVPLLLVLLDGRPVSQPIPGAMPLDELRTLFNQLGQQLTSQGITGRHQPRTTGTPAEGEGADGAEDEEPTSDPRFAAAEDALAEGDYAKGVEEYQKLVDANPADAEAAARLAMAQVLQRTEGVDLNTARAAAAENPDDIDAQTLVADLDLYGGHVDDAFNRLVEVVRRTSGADRDQARTHLIGLFAAVGNDDERVIRGRQNLASALF
jgi:putative thioredoxin